MNQPARIAMVTGAARRIGRVIALALARRGWDIAVHYGNSAIDAGQTVRDIIALGRRAVALQADLADEAAVLALPGRCAAALGEATCLVNNASLFDFDDPAGFGTTRFDAHMHANLAAPILLSREMHRRLSDVAVGGEANVGVIVNLLDQKLQNLNPDFLSYTLSKAGLEAATVMLAQALAPRLRVVGIAPGITLVSGDQSAEGFARAHARTPLGRSSTPEDVADAVCYVVEARAITGTTLVVDGGQHLVASPRDIMFLTQ